MDSDDEESTDYQLLLASDRGQRGAEVGQVRQVSRPLRLGARGIYSENPEQLAVDESLGTELPAGLTVLRRHISETLI